MKILIVSPEVHPFAKTGGLADVAGALPLELAALGHDVRVAMPRFGAVDEVEFNLLPILADVRVRLGGRELTADIKRTTIPDSAVPVYFVENAELFAREGLYLDPATGEPHADNPLRFAFFCKAVIWLLKGLGWIPDVIQCNDWPCGLLPVMLRTDPEMRADSELRGAKTLFTIHNLAYQGLFPLSEARALGLSDELLQPAALEYYGQASSMKGGILYADRISTVSRRYAEEIQTAEYGCGLEGVLSMHRDRMIGILNGIDDRVWDPSRDPLIAEPFGPGDLAGKAACKAALQEEMGLPQSPDTPLVGVISRLDPQKGFDLLVAVIDELLAGDVQFALLGSGAAQYHRLFGEVARRHPRKAGVRLAFDNGLAHRIEAGCDMFLMPSRYEPCGLNQLYSLRYGTIPVVRRTGGLADSIVDATGETVANGEGTGFVFDDFTAAALGRAIDRALVCYGDKPKWSRLVANAMAKDFSWKASARQYERLFEDMAKEG